MRNEELHVSPDTRPVSPSAERNKGSIADILKRVLPDHGTVLEVGSGTGQHVVHFAREMPGLIWQPSERDESSLQWIRQWMAVETLPNIRSPLRLDVTELPWQAGAAQAVVCLNMIHIAPWSAAEGLILGAETILGQGGVLFLYGPYRQSGVATSPSNEAFDRQLRSCNPEWGLRNVEDVARCAILHGFGAPDIHEMPANNLSVIFRKR
ncbi:DUF938 domain-containing protein [Mesorhizobium sp. KR2-14]|uniref:DUF938 domain-containing protein n=1 Tax=Mesorhizobium sp. KR2-14 TaxID=3156610 RepID=UPI0032B47DF6